MNCPQCGKDIEADSTFCRHCGATQGDKPPARRLVRLPASGRIAGVCAGIAEYLDTDVTFVRLAWVVLSIIPGCFVGGLLAYIAAWLIMPPSPGILSSAVGRKRLVRSAADRKLGGVCGGIAEYLGVDSTVVRLSAVILAIVPGTLVLGVLAYLAAWFIIPLPEQQAPMMIAAPHGA
jgi:phage shock protein C